MKIHPLPSRILAAVLIVATMMAPIAAAAPAAGPVVRIGSKPFTEGIVLGEVLAGVARQAGVAAEHRAALGGTQIVFAALERGEIDCYVEYSGTLEREILRAESVRSPADVAAALARRGLARTGPLGFDNTYALGMKETVAARAGIETISDLAGRDLAIALSDEFVRRADGWPAVRDAYELRQTPRVLDHALAYRGLESGHVAVTDLYATDPEVRAHELRILRDDRGVFREYKAFVLYRADLAERAPAFLAALGQLEGTIDPAAMREMNARVLLDGEPERTVAARFLRDRFGWEVADDTTPAWLTVARDVGRATLQHLALVAAALIAAVAVAVPLGIYAHRRPRLAAGILGVVGILQTIPSMAVLVFLVPLVGLGWKPAVVALFLYGLLPIVRGTFNGLAGIPQHLRESAEVLGLDGRSRLRLVELPLASRSILAGIKTAAVIAVGTATIGGLIGAGGYGEAILAGIRRADVGLLMQGAVPAAVLALLIQAACDGLERFLVPAGLRAGG
jgi:osmoprotectant transport system permease protein